MAIQDDFTIDVVDKKITYSTAFVDNRPPFIYTVNELYSYLQDTFDEPGFMQYEIPMSAQTPTQYTILNKWFIDDESMKALYGGSIQTSGWTSDGYAGIIGLRWADGAADAPTSADIAVTLTGGTSSATGKLLAVDETRQIAWVRSNSAGGQDFADGEAVTGTGVSFINEATRGALTGDSIWSNLFSVGSLQTETEIYVGQHPDYMGGTAFHDADADSRFERRTEKIDEWWDSDVDFATGSPNLLGGAGHFDILVKTQEAGITVDGQRLAVFARQFSKVFSHFELVGGVGNFVVPFSSGAADLNAQDGPYTVAFDARANNALEVGDVLENTTGAGSNSPEFRLRAVVTAVTGGASATGTFDYYLIGDTESVANNRTLLQLANNDNLKVRGDDTVLDVDGTPTIQAPGLFNPGAGVVTITFDDAQIDVDEDTVAEEYACTIDCATNPLADVYKLVMFLTARGNQDGTTANIQDKLLPSGRVDGYGEAGEFYRAVGDIIITWDARANAGISEGELVIGSISGATGVVVSATETATGVGVLTQVRGTFVENDVVSDIDDGATNTVTLDAAVFTSIVDNTAAPFGTFAGGRWFVAQGVVLTNVPTSDANNWETIDLTGAQVIPPTVRTITFDKLVANDRAALFEVDTPGGADITKSQAGQGVGAGGASIGAATIPLDNTVELDVPSTGWIRVVDTSLATTGVEYRFAYSAVSGTTVTLDQGAWSAGTDGGTGTTTRIIETGKFTNFGGEGELRIGMEIRNTTDGENATILRKVSNNEIETTPVTGWAGDAWVANAPVVALVDADTIYFPFIDDVATGTSISKNIKYSGADTDCIARARFSDPDVGGQRILPFVSKSVTVADADLTISAVRTDDTIAS